MSEQKRSGCKGCLIWFLVVLAVVVLVLGVSAYLGYRKLVSLRDQYTQSKPLVLPAASYSQADMDGVRQRVDSFLANARGSHTNAQLSLSANDLNALLASSGITNRVYVTFTNQMLAGQVSVPLEDLGIRFLRGRYLNGGVVFDVGRVDGELSVKVKDVSVNGLALPEHYMKNIRDVNYAQGVMTNTTANGAFKHVSRVGIEGDRLILEVGGTNAVP